MYDIATVKNVTDICIRFLIFVIQLLFIILNINDYKYRYIYRYQNNKIVVSHLICNGYLYPKTYYNLFN